MPIHCPLQIADLSQDRFDQIDRLVMGNAFACQNDLGRLCDESTYENDMALRLRAIGSDVSTQVPITVSHDTFSKRYRLDFVCDHAVYDFKAVQDLVGRHDAQVFHYAMLLDIRHVKLLNFRSAKVQGRLRFNALTKDGRFQYTLCDEDTRSITPECDRLRCRMVDLLHDWGAFLDARLYEEALVHFCSIGGTAQKRLELARNGNSIGTHAFQRHHDDMAFIVSSVTKQPSLYYSHLKRLLSLTRLKGIQWINLNHSRIELKTVV